MGQITSSVGIISGINTSAIISALLTYDQAPVTLLQSQVASNTAQQQAYTALETQLQSLQTIGQSLELPTTFAASTSTSSNPSVLTATTTAGAPEGSYQFQVAQLVSAQQSISNGYSSTSAPLQAGTISIEMGGGSLDPQTDLSSLNGGAGIGRGEFRITDSTGKTDVIDTSSAVTLDDVVNSINNSLDITVHASIQDDHLVLKDTSGGSGTLSVQDLGSGTSAKDLGIVGTATGTTLTGTSIDYLGTGTTLSSLNDGRGIRTTTGSGDFTITAADGSTSSVSIGAAQTVGDVINEINTASNGKVKASLATNAKGITLTDETGGGGTLSVADTNGSNAAADLGIQQTGTGGVINGSQVISGLDTVLVNSLEGGSGLTLGQISITDRANDTPSVVDLSGAKTVQQIIDTINSATGGKVTAALNSSGDGIQLQDNSGGSGNLVIADSNGGTTAETLGIAGSYDTNTTAVSGSDLHLQFVSQNTLLSTYNGGQGVGNGSFTIANSTGASSTITLAQGADNTIGDVINAINAKSLGVTASINSNGNGILLTANTTGGGHLTVTGVTGTTAADLNIAGTATGNTIDGAMEKTIAVTSSDTLTTLQSKISALGFGVTASIINDGSSQTPYRLSLTAVNSGKAGSVIVDGGTTGLQMRNLVQAQDAAVFVGGTGSAEPLLVTSSSNQITNVIPGVTLSLQSASSTPVSLSITRDGTAVATQLQTFATTFNTLVDSLNTYTQYNTTTNQGGLLLGDSTAQTIQDQMYSIFQGVVSSAGQYRTLADIGMTLGTGAKITFDADTFNSAFAANPDAVANLFTSTSGGLGTLIDDSMKTLVDPVDGAITLENQTLTNKNTDANNQITQMNKLIADKQTRLENQFANMESILASLQSQQAALGSLTGSTAKASTSTASTASSSSTSSSTAA